jgi:hypothetical protein
MLLTGQRGGEANSNPQRVDETCKSTKITHLREDNSEIKLGPLGWGFSIGLVTESCKKSDTQNPRKKRNWTDKEDGGIPKKILTYNPRGRRDIGCPQLRWKDQCTLQEDGTGQVYGLILEEEDDNYIQTPVCTMTTISMHTLRILGSLQITNI